METLEQTKQNVADLHWLATLLTGCRDTATEVTFEAIPAETEAHAFFSDWMRAWSRRLVIANSLAAVREDLAQSANRIALIPAAKLEVSPGSWTLDAQTTKSELERALLPIDVFPRAAVLLLLFERVPLQDAAILLDAKPELVRKALAAGARDLTIHLAKMQGWKAESEGAISNWETHHVRATEG